MSFYFTCPVSGIFTQRQDTIGETSPLTPFFCRCLIPSLKTLAARKFIDSIAQHYDSPAFAMAIEEVYENSLDRDRGLREPILDLLMMHPEVRARDDVREVLQYTPTLEYELSRVKVGLPAYDED